MAEKTVVYGTQRIVLSRVYPFGKDVDGKTEITVQEPTARDEIISEKKAEKNDTHSGYELLAQITGLQINEIEMLARKDTQAIQVVVGNF